VSNHETHQQDPTPPSGNLIRWEWCGTYDEALAREDFQFIVPRDSNGFGRGTREDAAEAGILRAL
jgi:hypothetical protein